MIIALKIKRNKDEKNEDFKKRAISVIENRKEDYLKKVKEHSKTVDVPAPQEEECIKTIALNNIKEYGVDIHEIN